MKHPINELIKWVAASALFLLCFFIAAAVTGCAQTKLDKVMDISIGQKPAISCPKLVMPPIPQECVIDIRGDVLTASSQECENLIRYYVKARQLLRPVASVPVAGTTQP